MYQVFEVAERFQVSVEAVRKWCMEFEKYLSPRANPGPNKTRHLSQEDLAVLGLVVERRAQGMTYEEIHLELQNGGRGSIPTPPIPSEDKTLVILERMRQLVGENEKLHLELTDYKMRLEQLEKLRDEAIRAQATLEMERIRAERAETTIQQLLNERRELDREIARLRVMLEQKDNS